MIFPKKQLEGALEVGFFLIFVIFVFHGTTLGHVSGHVVQYMKKIGLGKLHLSLISEVAQVIFFSTPQISCI